MTEIPDDLSPEILEKVAERFRLLGDPLRLRLLQLLRGGERSVTELVDASGATQANVSKHLQLLARAGLVGRRKEGLHVLYRVADPRVFDLCDVVCGTLNDHLSRELAVLESLRGAPARRRSRRRS